MRAWQVVAPGDASALREVTGPDPVPGAGEVLVDVSACAVCRTDLQIATGDIPPHRSPVVPGHQVVGRVAEVGAGVPAERVGTRVGLVWIAGADGTCRFCRSGRENLCPAAEFTGWDVDGGFATHVLARSDYTFDLPPLGASFTDAGIAPLLCGGVIGYRSLRVAGLGPSDGGARLGLYGFGASATVVVQVARHWGLEPYVVTRSTAEAQRAITLGAVWAGTYDDTPPVALDAAITFAPVGSVVVAALKALERGGVVAVNAIHLDGGVPAFDYDDLWLERSIRSVANVTRQDVREFLALVPEAGVRTQYEELPLAQAPEALDRLGRGDVRGAFVLRA